MVFRIKFDTAYTIYAPGNQAWYKAVLIYVPTLTFACTSNQITPYYQQIQANQLTTNKEINYIFVKSYYNTGLHT